MWLLAAFALTGLGAGFQPTVHAHDKPLVVTSTLVTSALRVRKNIDSKRPSEWLHPGESAELIESLPGWHKVRLANGWVGFVSTSYSYAIPRVAAGFEDELRTRGSREFDGPWTGTMACEACAECAGAIESGVSIVIQGGQFKLAPDESYVGRGLINAWGHMMVRRGEGTDRTFSFFGVFDGEAFNLRGHRGTATCQITLRR